jgi:predicted nucleotidyltransferase component of viral defense system
LRIFYDLDRFSEDLDFSLLTADENFSLEPYFKALKVEFESLGIDIDITQKENKSQTPIESAFLKSDTTMHILSLDTKKLLKNSPVKQQIKIKFEVDTNPPLGFNTEAKLLLQPFSFYTPCYVIEDLFAGKMHALLFRAWKQRVKGRDWYDFEWYVKNGYALNLEHLSIRARESGHLGKNESFTKESLLLLLEKKIASLDMEMVKVDIRRFIKDDKVLDIWSVEYFMSLARMMKSV